MSTVKQALQEIKRKVFVFFFPCINCMMRIFWLWLPNNIFLTPEMILQTTEMHSEMGFNWHGILYMVFCISKMTKRNTFRCTVLLQQHVKGNRLLLKSCSLIPAKWGEKTSCSAQWLRFVFCFYSELEHTRINSILFMLYCTETMKNNGMMLESHRSWF